MSTRQQVGARKRHRSVQERGVERRHALLQAARALLEEKDIDAVSFRDIAERAGVPEGSAYHFYANRYDLFTALVAELSEEFIAAHQRPVPASKRVSWQSLAEYMVGVGARIYGRNPAARQLLIGGKAPPEVKQADRLNDRAVGAAMYQAFVRHFPDARSAELRDAFYYFIEITDLLFMLSVIEHGRITSKMLAQAKRAGVAYLASYLEAG